MELKVAFLFICLVFSAFIANSSYSLSEVSKPSLRGLSNIHVFTFRGAISRACPGDGSSVVLGVPLPLLGSHAPPLFPKPSSSLSLMGTESRQEVTVLQKVQASFPTACPPTPAEKPGSNGAHPSAQTWLFLSEVQAESRFGEKERQSWAWRAGQGPSHKLPSFCYVRHYAPLCLSHFELICLHPKCPV